MLFDEGDGNDAGAAGSSCGSALADMFGPSGQYDAEQDHLFSSLTLWGSHHATSQSSRETSLYALREFGARRAFGVRGRPAASSRWPGSSAAACSSSNPPYLDCVDRDQLTSDLADVDDELPLDESQQDEAEHEQGHEHEHDELGGTASSPRSAPSERDLRSSSCDSVLGDASVEQPLGDASVEQPPSAVGAVGASPPQNRRRNEVSYYESPQSALRQRVDHDESPFSYNEDGADDDAHDDAEQQELSRPRAARRRPADDLTKAVQHERVQAAAVGAALETPVTISTVIPDEKEAEKWRQDMEEEEEAQAAQPSNDCFPSDVRLVPESYTVPVPSGKKTYFESSGSPVSSNQT